MAVTRVRMTAERSLVPGPGSLLYQTPVTTREVRERPTLSTSSQAQPMLRLTSPM